MQGVAGCYNPIMNGDLGKQYLKSYIQETNTEYEQFLDGEVKKAAEISKIPAEMLKRFSKTALRGKRVRGSLMQLGYEVAGGVDGESIQTASFSVELVHAGLLVHDDIMDRDDTRRGLISMHRQYEELGRALRVVDPEHFGVSLAIDVADAVYYTSMKVLLDSNFPAENVLAAAKIYAEYAIRTAHGQALDVATITLQSLSEKDILQVIKYKSAEYTGVMPFLMGAALAGMSDMDRINGMREYAYAFGWAFQIQDDILGLYGEQESVGKPIGSDIQEGKNTLLMLKLFEMGTDEDRAFLKMTLGKEDVSIEEIRQMRERVKKSGAYQSVYDIGMKYVDEGITHVTTITKDTRLQETLESLIVYMMERAV